MAADELTKLLLLEEVAAPRAIAEALFASVTGGVPVLQTLVDAGAATPELMTRYLARSEAPFLRHVAVVSELVERLPPGLCHRLLALPVRLDAITGTVDVVVADTADPHPATEIAFHLGVPVRVVRAPVSAIEEALRRLRMAPRDYTPPIDRYQEPSRQSEEELYDSRPQAGYAGARRSPSFMDQMSNRRMGTLPPPEPALSNAMPSEVDVPPRRGGLVIENDSSPPSAPPHPVPHPGGRVRTPPWGTPIHVPREQTPRMAPVRPATEPPKSGYGSEIPIPLTRKTVLPSMVHGGTQRPAGLMHPGSAGLGEGYAFDTTGLIDAVEKAASPRIDNRAGPAMPAAGQPTGSLVPGPPPMPGWDAPRARGPAEPAAYAAYAPQLPFAEMGGVLAALRNAGSRDEVLELVLTGARVVALKVAVFVVKRGGYLGWAGTPEFADRSALQSVLIPLEANSIFDRAIREDLYLGPIRNDEIHAPLLRVMKHASRDVAAVPIRVSGKTAVVIVADELGDTMTGTRRLEELARAAGEAFARIVRTRR